jgi:hypothetical protein
LTQRESKQNENKEETIPSPSSVVQREIENTLVDPTAPVDMPRDIVVQCIKDLPRLKKTLHEEEEHTSHSRHIPRKKKKIELSFSHEPLH